MQEVDPDIITGYNIINFDIPYLLNRAKALKVRYIHVQCSFLYHPCMGILYMYGLFRISLKRVQMPSGKLRVGYNLWGATPY